MIPIKRTSQLRKRARTLTPGEVVAVGDLIAPRGINDVLYRLTALDTRWVGVVVGQHTTTVLRPAPPPDPMVKATLRIRAKTSLGQLEKLLAERATARRRVTTAITHLESIDNAISRLTRTLADASLESDLARINQTNTP